MSGADTGVMFRTVLAFLSLAVIAGCVGGETTVVPEARYEDDLQLVSEVMESRARYMEVPEMAYIASTEVIYCEMDTLAELGVPRFYAKDVLLLGGSFYPPYALLDSTLGHCTADKLSKEMWGHPSLVSDEELEYTKCSLLASEVPARKEVRELVRLLEEGLEYDSDEHYFWTEEAMDRVGDAVEGVCQEPETSYSENVSSQRAESVREQWAGVDAQVRAIFDPTNSSDGETPRFDGGVVSAVAELPEVSYVDAGLFSFERAYTVGSDGEILRPAGPPVFTASWGGPSLLSSFEIVDGEPPVGQQVAIDLEQAAQGGFVIGEDITISLPSGETEVFTLSGTVDFRKGGTGGAFFVLFDLPTTQRVLELPGLVDSILVAAVDGVSQQELVDAISSLLPDGIEALTGEAAIAEELAQWQ